MCLNLVEGKNPLLCAVKYCRNPRAKKKRTCSRCYMREWRLQNPARSAYSCVRESARRRRIAFTITFEQFLEIVKDTHYIDGKGVDRYSYHLDRIDNTRGYEPDNLQVLTAHENCVKANLEKRKMYVGFFRCQHDTELPLIPDGEDPF